MRKDPVTILYLITELDVGGAERNLYELATRTDRGRYRPVVAALSGGGRVGQWLADAGVPVHDLALRSCLDVGGFFRLVRLLRRERVQILHSFLFHANLIGRLAAVIAVVPVVISSVRVAERERPWHVWLDGLTSWLVDVETVVSDAVKRFTHARGGVPMRKLVTIRNGVDVSRFKMGRTRARAELGLDKDVPVVVFVGRFERQKGADLIPRIIRHVRRRVPRVRFLLVGRGGLLAGVEAQVKELGLEAAAEFMGQRDDVPRILAASDVLMLPSRWEGLANVILEAQAAGAVVVAADVEGSREIIQDALTGLVVPAGRAGAMAEGLVRILLDDEGRKRIAEAAKRAVTEGLTIEQTVWANYALHERLLAKTWQ